MKKTVGARELKTRLGTYIDQVRHGTTFVVTERGRPVAELRPLDNQGNGQESLLNELVATGVLSRASSDAFLPFKPIRLKGKSLSKTIIDDRKDRL